ncbi:MAG: tetratricopeptide repeat protein [Thermoplasmatota archaeon]
MSAGNEDRIFKTLPLVGRDVEFKNLKKHLEEASEGKGSFITVEGEPGIGKTRLIEEFEEFAKDDGFSLLKGRTDINSREPFHLFSDALKESISEPLFEDLEKTSFTEMFAVDDSGLLLATAHPEGEEDMDGDIFAGMLSAVQNFVRDSFDQSGQQKGGLGRLEYGDMKILIEHGSCIYIAAVIRGQEHPEMKNLLTRTVREIEEEFSETLEGWSGDMDDIKGIQEKISNVSKSKFTVRRNLEGVELDNERVRIADNVLNYLEEVSENNSLLLILEDLQWVDESSLFVFEYLGRNINEKNVMILGSARPGESVKYDKTRGDMVKNGNLSQIELESLGEKAVYGIVEELFSPNDFSEEFIEGLSESCQGNPFFVIELLKQLEQEGNIEKVDGVYEVTKEDYAPPDSIEEVVVRRLELLEPEDIAFVEYISCEGGEIDTKVTDYFPLISDVEESVSSLTSSGILVPRDDKIEFSHAIFRDVIYDNVPRWWKVSHHRNLGAYYEETFVDNVEGVLYELARHFYNTNEHEKAFDYSFRAGEKAENELAPEQAVRFYNNSLDVMKDLKVSEKPISKTDILNRLGDSRGLMGDFSKAIEDYKIALKEEEDESKLATLHRKVANVFMNIGDYDKGLEECDKGIDLLGDELKLENAKIERVKGRIYIRLGDYDKANEHLLKALEVAEEFDDEKEMAEIEHNLGATELYRANYDKSLRHFDNALKYRDSIGDKRGESKTMTNIGLVYDYLGRSDLSLKYYDQSLKSFKDIGDKLNLGMVFNNIGLVYEKKGELEKTLEYYNKSLRSMKKVGDKSNMAMAMNNIGNVYQDMGELEKALKHHKESLDIRKNIGDKQGIATSLVNIGKVLQEKGEYDESLKYYVKSLKLGEKIGEKYNSIYAYRFIGELKLEKRDLKSAESNIKKSIEISKETKSRTEEGISRAILGKIYQESRKTEKSLQEYEKAEKIFKESGENKDYSKLLKNIGSLYIEMKNHEKATEYLLKAKELQGELGLERELEMTKELLNEID